MFRYYHTFDLNPSIVNDKCERIDYNSVDEVTFIERYEKPARPVVICNGQFDWPASRKWTTEVNQRGREREKRGERERERESGVEGILQ